MQFSFRNWSRILSVLHPLVILKSIELDDQSEDWTLLSCAGPSNRSINEPFNGLCADDLKSHVVRVIISSPSPAPHNALGVAFETNRTDGDFCLCWENSVSGLVGPGGGGVELSSLCGDSRCFFLFCIFYSLRCFPAAVRGTLNLF